MWLFLQLFTVAIVTMDRNLYPRQMYYDCNKYWICSIGDIYMRVAQCSVKCYLMYQVLWMRFPCPRWWKQETSDLVGGMDNFVIAYACIIMEYSMYCHKWKKCKEKQQSFKTNAFIPTIETHIKIASKYSDASIFSTAQVQVRNFG